MDMFPASHTDKRVGLLVANGTGTSSLHWQAAMDFGADRPKMVLHVGLTAWRLRGAAGTSTGCRLYGHVVSETAIARYRRWCLGNLTE